MNLNMSAAYMDLERHIHCLEENKDPKRFLKRVKLLYLIRFNLEKNGLGDKYYDLLKNLTDIDYYKQNLSCELTFGTLYHNIITYCIGKYRFSYEQVVGEEGLWYTRFFISKDKIVELLFEYNVWIHYDIENTKEEHLQDLPKKRKLWNSFRKMHPMKDENEHHFFLTLVNLFPIGRGLAMVRHENMNVLAAKQLKDLIQIQKQNLD